MESLLSHNLFTLAADAGYELGYGRAPANWSGWQAGNPWVPSSPDTQLADILLMIDRAVRLVQNPPPADPQSPPHRWSWMAPEATLTTVATQTDYPLPDDYGGFQGEMTFAPSANQGVTIKRVGIGQVRRAIQTSSGLTMAPQWFAEVPQPFDGVTGQRFAVAFFPAPDQAYVLTFRYNRLAQKLTAQQPYPYGGEQFANLYSAAVLAACEQRINDEMGPRTADFKEILAAAVAVDARQHRPSHLGYNGDRSDGPAGYYGSDFWGPHSWTDIVTYDGNSMGP